jgi:hypothetical protein
MLITQMGGLIFMTTKDRITTFSYTCLPDTIDPRGPKGGGR